MKYEDNLITPENLEKLDFFYLSETDVSDNHMFFEASPHAGIYVDFVPTPIYISIAPEASDQTNANDIRLYGVAKIADVKKLIKLIGVSPDESGINELANNFWESND